MAASEWRSGGVLAGLFLLTAGFIAYAIAPASVLPLFRAEFSIGKPAASASISAVFLTWAVLQIPGGYLLDRYDNRRLVFIGAVVFVLASTGGLLTRSYPVFLITRLISGTSVVFIFVGSVNILSRILPEVRRALGLSIFIASPPFGIAIAQFAGPLIAVPYGWRAAVLRTSSSEPSGPSSSWDCSDSRSKRPGVSPFDSSSRRCGIPECYSSRSRAGSRENTVPPAGERETTSQ